MEVAEIDILDWGAEQVARAAIAAMREPTQEMLDASRRALGQHIRSLPKAEREAVVGNAGGFRVYDETLKARVRFQAMIDTAMKETA